MNREWFFVTFLCVLIAGFTSISPVWGQDLSIWESTWFQVKVTYKGVAFEGGVFSIDNEVENTYLKIRRWDSVNNVLEVTWYGFEEGSWHGFEVTFHVVGGNSLDFLIRFDLQGNGWYEGFVARVKGNLGKEGQISSAQLKSLGGFYWEIDDIPGSNDRWAGGVTISGKWIPESKVPPILFTQNEKSSTP